MGRYLYDNDDLNNPVELMETASVIMADVVDSLGAIADLFTNIVNGDGPQTELDSQTMAALMRMLQGGAKLAKNKLDYGLELQGKQVA